MSSSTTSSASATATKTSLDVALHTLLQNNFDADSKVCIVTLMKVLDNVLQKPGNEKVRSIRLQNPAFTNKVGKRMGGIDFLVACGFAPQQPPATLLSVPTTEPEFLVLEPSREDTSHLVTARRMLLMCATHELKMRAEELPKYIPPPPPIQLSSSPSSSPFTRNAETSSASFNPYQGQRYDGLSAAVGANLGPDSESYISPTEQKLAQLQQKQAKLQQTMHIPLQDRELTAIRPGHRTSAPASTGATNVTGSVVEDTGGGGNNNYKSDASLLAAYAVKQAEQTKQAATAGFTTKAMRDLAKLEKSKVYSHVVLSIQFPDGSSLRGKWLPLETVGTVEQVVLDCCHKEGPWQNTIHSNDSDGNANTASSVLELYITPPRRRLDPHKTLQSEGLVPASKVYVSWKTGPPPGPPGHFLLPTTIGGAVAFPKSAALVAGSSEADEAMDDGSKPSGFGSKQPKKKKPKSKEDDLLKRMMGGGRGL
jgi:hypothetical protein